jgi:hypothetical protein
VPTEPAYAFFHAEIAQLSRQLDAAPCDPPITLCAAAIEATDKAKTIDAALQRISLATLLLGQPPDEPERLFAHGYVTVSARATAELVHDGAVPAVALGRELLELLGDFSNSLCEGRRVGGLHI